MEIAHFAKTARRGPGALALSMILAGGFASADNTVLATADQQLVESRALKILATPEVKEQIEASTRAFANLPFAADSEAQRTLRPAVEELAFATALDGVSTTPKPRPTEMGRSPTSSPRRIQVSTTG